MSVLRVLTFNIHKGFDPLMRRNRIADFRRALHDLNPDFVFLQEVQELEGRIFRGDVSDFSTKLEFFADSLWPHFAYGKNSIYSAGHHGNAILSRIPYMNYDNFDLSTNSLEKRGLLHGVVKSGEVSVHLLCTHLNLMPWGRRIQAQEIIRRVRETISVDSALILAGDFNEPSKALSKTFLDFVGLRDVLQESGGSSMATFPSWFPLLALDRIYFRGLSPVGARVLSDGPWGAFSDHLAIYAEFESEV